MLERLQQKWLSIILTIVIISTGLSQFLAVYHIGDKTFAFGLIACICLVTGLIKNSILRLALYALSYFYGLYHYFPHDQRFSFQWLGEFIDTTLGSFRQMASGQLGYLSGELALSLILFLAMSLIFMQIELDQWLLCFFMVASYLLMIVVFNQIDLSREMLLIAFCSLLFYLNTKLQDEKFLRKKSVPLLIGTLLLGAFSFAALYFPLEELKSGMLENTSFVRNHFNKEGLYSLIQQYGLPTPAKTGFSENDNTLGGPLLDENSVLFTAQQEKRHYWRVESKDYYTGQGWTKSSGEASVELDGANYYNREPLYRKEYHPGTEIKVEFFGSGKYIPLPYGSSSVEITNGHEGFTFDLESGRVDFQHHSVSSRISILWMEQDYHAADLENVPITYTGMATVDYTQLPSEVPDRVYQLGEELTVQSTTLYDKVTDIEHYLKNSGNFRYSKMDTPYTPENTDYVDYFLFDSQVGYCDNFSSAMVVLLRTQGIPARWVKGFAPGEEKAGEDDLATFTVRNNDAHSWVEVYFEGYGWLPFEPTPSFANPDRPRVVAQPAESTAASAEASAESSSTAASAETSQSVNRGELEDDDQVTTKEEMDWASARRVVFTILAIAVVVAAVYLFRKYHYLAEIWMRLKWSSTPLASAFPVLLKQAEYHLFRPSAEALESYAGRVEKNYPKLEGAFLSLTLRYEKELYGKVLDGEAKDKEQIKAQMIHASKVLGAKIDGE